MANKRLVMLIDVKRCIGCNTCALACKVENNLPDGIWWNRALTRGGKERDTPAGVYPHLALGYLTFACQHCENPPCVKACPVKATYKREEDGVVIQDYNRCIGCRYCMIACPYTGVRQFNQKKPEYQLAFAVGGGGVPVHQEYTVEKCMYCAHRLAEGKEPMCIAGCPARARHFGDQKDPDSNVSKLLRRRSHFQLRPELGTNPSVYFLT